MNDHTEVIKMLQDEIRTLDYMSKPTPNVVTEHFAKENIAKAVKIHAAIDALKAIGSQEPVAWQHCQRGPTQTEWQEWHTVGYKPQGPENSRFKMRPLFIAAGAAPTKDQK